MQVGTGTSDVFGISEKKMQKFEVAMYHCICLLLNTFSSIDVKTEENCLINLETKNSHIPNSIVTNLIQFSERNPF